MTREIIFRGIPDTNSKIDSPSSLDVEYVDDGFVYGNLISPSKTVNRYLIVGGCSSYDSEEYNAEFWVPVRTETIGQYTGFNDSDGVKIFEGDIIEVILQSGCTIFYEVRFESQQAAVWLFASDWGKVPIQWLASPRIKTIKIVGNIYANAQLMAERKECEWE